jgi:hypothetical protein
MTIPSLREIVHAMLLSTLSALCGELINGSLALRLCDFQPEAHLPVARAYACKTPVDAKIEFIYRHQASNRACAIYYYFAFSRAQRL